MDARDATGFKNKKKGEERFDIGFASSLMLLRCRNWQSSLLQKVRLPQKAAASKMPETPLVQLQTRVKHTS